MRIFLSSLLELENCRLGDWICAIVFYNWLNRSLFHSEFQRLSNWILLLWDCLFLINKALLWLKFIVCLWILLSCFLRLLLLTLFSHSLTHLWFWLFNLLNCSRLLIIGSPLFLSCCNGSGIHRTFLLFEFGSIKWIWAHRAQVTFFHLLCQFLWGWNF